MFRSFSGLLASIHFTCSSLEEEQVCKAGLLAINAIFVKVDLQVEVLYAQINFNCNFEIPQVEIVCPSEGNHVRKGRPEDNHLQGRILRGYGTVVIVNELVEFVQESEVERMPKKGHWKHNVATHEQDFAHESCVQ